LEKKTKTAYVKAQRLFRTFKIYAIGTFFGITFFLILLMKTPSEVHTAAGDVPNPEWGVVVGITAILVTLLVLPIGGLSAEIALLQMEQAEQHAKEQRATESALANAIGELTKELRRPPQQPISVVTFTSLFPPSKSR
jgi:hypothetical protein